MYVQPSSLVSSSSLSKFSSEWQLAFVVLAFVSYLTINIHAFLLTFSFFPFTLTVCLLYGFPVLVGVQPLSFCSDCGFMEFTIYMIMISLPLVLLPELTSMNPPSTPACILILVCNHHRLYKRVYVFSVRFCETQYK